MTHTYTVCLRIFGPDVDPEEVTSSLGVTPTLTHVKGDPKTHGNQFSESMWSLEVFPERGEQWESLEDGLNSLLEKMTPFHDQIAGLKATAVIWCGHFTSSFDGGPSFSPKLLKALGELGVELILDTYCE